MKATLLTLMLAGISTTLSANIIVYVEGPGVQTSHLGGTVIEGFNSSVLGPVGPYASAIGTYSAGGSVQPSDIWGGANRTSYIAVGAQSGSTSFSLTFAGPQTFFGFYWMAAEAANRVEFYNGSTRVAGYSATDVLGGLPSTYLGNPNTSTAQTEKFAYVYFLSDNIASDFTRVVFSNGDRGTGFETDNHTILGGGSLSGGAASGVPEPATFGLMVPVLGAIALAARRRKK